MAKHSARPMLGGAALLVALSGPAFPSPATAAITAPVRTTACVNIPTLVNGDFEDFTNPATMTVDTQPVGSYISGIWHGYGYGNGPTSPSLPAWSGPYWVGPNQILYLHDASTTSPYGNQNVPGWRTTDTSTRLVELQRQVDTYTWSTEQNGTDHYYYDIAGTPTTQTTQDNTLTPLEQQGVSSASLVTWRGGQNYWDAYGPQAASGTYWAELNAISSAALYQDIDVTSGETYFWSLKHRGRTNTPEQMYVKIGPATGTLVNQTALDKYAPTNADTYSGIPTYGTTPTSETQLIDTLGSGWARYAGAYTASATGPARFQFEAGPTMWGGAFGNLLDDIQFTPFIACPTTVSLQVGQTSTIDVGSSPMSYGIEQSLDQIGNTTASISEFSTSGNSISFTPSAAGTFTADYQLTMTVAGTTYTAASQITYVVSAAPSPPPAPAPSTNASDPTPEPTPEAEQSSSIPPRAQGAPAITGTARPGGRVTCTAPTFEGEPDTTSVALSVDGSVFGAGDDGTATGTIPRSTEPGASVTCTVEAMSGTASTTVASSVLVRRQGSDTCSGRTRTAAVFFASLQSRLDPPAKRILRRLEARACKVSVTGYVQPVGTRGNDLSLSRARATAVANYLKRLGARVTSVQAGKRALQKECTEADNRCVITRITIS